MKLSESVLFVREYFRNYRATGAVLPSGRSLARALCHFVAHGDGPKRILEVGPGTGAVTRRLVRCLSPEDRLDLVELNDSFVERLKHRFQHDPAFQRVAGQAQVHHCPVEDLPCNTKYDVIVSGLPLNNFHVAEVERILCIFQELLRPGGTLSFFEYIAIRHARAIFAGRKDRERLRGIHRALKGLLKNEIRRDWIWPNVPPAWVHHVRFNASSAPAS